MVEGIVSYYGGYYCMAKKKTGPKKLRACPALYELLLLIQESSDIYNENGSLLIKIKD